MLKSIVASALDLVTPPGATTPAPAAAAASDGESESTEPNKTIYLPSLKRFCEMAAERAASQGMGLALTYDAEKKRVRVSVPGPMIAPAGQPHPWVDVLPYYNAYANCDHEDDESKAFVFAELLKLCAAKLSPIGNFDEIRPMLRARLRLASQLELFDLQCRLRGDDAVDIPHRVIAEQPRLVAELCVERAETIAVVTEHHLRAWGRAFDGLLDEIIAELAAKSDASRWRRVPDESGAYLAQFRDGFDATRILLPSLIRKLALNGRPVIMVPHNEVLLVAGSADPRGLLAMLNVVISLLPKLPDAVCGMWSLTSAGAWKPFAPPSEEIELTRMHRNLSARGLGQQYHSQKQLLDKLNEKKEDKIMVASATLMQNGSTGDVLSHCIWQMGMENLLPRTDIIMLCTPENIARPIVGQAKFDELMREMGSAVTITTHEPPRWLCKKDVFPSAEAIVRLSGEGFDAPEMKDAHVKLQEMIAEAHREKERAELHEKLL